MAQDEAFDVSKISFGVYPSISDKYIILNAGSAIGRANGPLLVSRRKIYPDEIDSLRLAIPGVETTANLLFSIAFPKAQGKKTYLFSDIEEAILSDEVDAGLLIHETRFTYESRGLRKIVDIGEWWETYYGHMVPLGGIVARRSLPQEVLLSIQERISASVQFAFAHPEAGMDFIRHHAQCMDQNVVQKHIKLYVNEYSANLGKTGQDSIEHLLVQGAKLGLLPKAHEPLFAPDICNV